MIVNGKRGAKIKPSREEFDLVVEAIRYEYKNNPETPDSSSLLNSAKQVSSKRIPKGTNILLDITKHAELSKISNGNIRNAISRLEIVEKILNNRSPRTHISSGIPRTIPISIPNDPLRFWLVISDSFDNWYAAYQFKKNMKLEDMSLKSLEHIYKWVAKIYGVFELNTNPDIVLIEKDFKGDGLDFLCDRNLIEYYNLGYRGTDNEQMVELTLNVENFMAFKPKVEKAYLSRLDKPIRENRPKSELGLAPDTKWENITIIFVNGHDIKIKVKEKTFLSDFKQMGFEDKKNHLPNKQWEFLVLLSRRNGELSWRDSDASDLLKKKKQLLSKALKAFFQIDEDPFFPYRKEKAYRIKINLIPE